MKDFTIENETNNIAVHGSVKEAEAIPNSERFSSEAALAKLAANWPAARLIEIWNSLPGETQVKKFKDRATAVSRIWKAIQNLDQTGPAVEESAPVSEAALVAEATETALVVEATETAPVAEQQGSEAAPPAVATAESPEPASTTPVAPQAPNVAPEAGMAPRRRPGPKRLPSPRPRKILVHPEKAARPAR